MRARRCLPLLQTLDRLIANTREMLPEHRAELGDMLDRIFTQESISPSASGGVSVGDSIRERLIEIRDQVQKHSESLSAEFQRRR